MLNKKNLTMMGLLTAIMAMVLSIAAFIFTVNATAEDASLSGGAVESVYAAGSVFTPSEAKITYNGATKDAAPILHYPNGNAYVEKEYTLSTHGKYELEYKAYFDGTPVSFYRNFSVVDTPASLFSINGRGNVVYSDTVYKEDAYGALFTLNAGTTVTYNRTIDLSDSGLSAPLLRFCFPVETVKQREVKQLEVRFVDIHDESNYIRVNYILSEGVNNAMYVKAAIGEGLLTGMEWRSTQLHVNDKWGFPHYIPGAGEPGTLPGCDGDLVSQASELFYDAADRAIYMRGEGGTLTSRLKVMDFDDSQFTTTPWTKDIKEARMEMKLIDSATASARIFITDLDGTSMANEYLYDNMKPEITVDLGEYEEDSLPIAQVGKSYEIFSASAFDFADGVLEPTIKVYYGENEAQRVNVSVTDGTFTPVWQGTYLIEYTASDFTGNSAEKTITVEAVKDVETISVAFSENNETGVVGVRKALAVPDISGGASEKYTSEIVVTDAKGNKVTVEDGAILPTTEGIYRVVYTAIDYIGNRGSGEYTVTVSYANHPIIGEDLEAPRVLYKGVPYTFPSAKAYDYKAGQDVTATVSIKMNGGSYTDLTDLTYTPDTAGDMTLKYSFTGVDGSANREFHIKVVDIGNRTSGFKRTAYFVSDDNVTVTADSSKIRVATSNDSSFFYALPLLVSNFQVRFGVPTGYDNFGSLHFTLTDSENDNLKVTAKICKGNNGTAYFSVNNGVEYQIAGNIGDGSTLTLQYNDSSRSFYVGKDIVVPNFDGFISGKVWLDVAFESVTGNAAIDCTRLGAQTMNNASSNISFNPYITIVDMDKSGGTADYGSVMTTSKAIAADVLSPQVNLTVTVTDNSGKVLSSVDGVKLENVSAEQTYDILLDFYGSVRVTYTAKENGTNASTQGRYFTYIEDTEAPVITVSGNVPVAARIGDTVTLPSYSAIDNCSKTEDISLMIFVKDASGVMSMLKTNSFVADKEGTYTVLLTATDDEGNRATERFTIIVY